MEFIQKKFHTIKLVGMHHHIEMRISSLDSEKISLSNESKHDEIWILLAFFGFLCFVMRRSLKQLRGVLRTCLHLFWEMMKSPLNIMSAKNIQMFSSLKSIIIIIEYNNWWSINFPICVRRQLTECISKSVNRKWKLQWNSKNWLEQTQQSIAHPDNPPAIAKYVKIINI